MNSISGQIQESQFTTTINYMLIEINTTEDVKLFAYQLVNEENLSFHPDDDFEDYINLETKEPLYSTEECKQLNQLMYNCFSICQEEEVENIIVTGKQIDIILRIDRKSTRLNSSHRSLSRMPSSA